MVPAGDSTPALGGRPAMSVGVSGSSGDTTALSIAILGTRCVPARYSGFETFAEQAARLLSAERPGTR